MKRWKHGVFIPVMHEPGVQRGFRQSPKTHGKPSSEHASGPHKIPLYYPTIPWGREMTLSVPPWYRK